MRLPIFFKTFHGGLLRLSGRTRKTEETTMAPPTKISRRRTLVLLGATLAAPLATPHAARAQASTWPVRPVRYMLGFPAGGATDTLSRLFCQKMAEITGQQFVVENRPGAGGVIGTDAIAKAQPDGTTLGMGSIASNVIGVGTYAKLPFRAGADFTFITGLWQLPNILVANKDFPVKDAKEMLALLKKEPGKHAYASAGIGTTLHLSGEMMKSMAGLDLQHIPYKGGNPAMIDLLAGRVPMLFDNLPGSLPGVRAGEIKAIAVTTRERSPALPDVPSFHELLPGFELASWTALCGPANMPADLVARINELSMKALNDPVVKQKFVDLGATTWPTSSAEITAYRDKEEARLLPVIRAAGINPQ